MADGHWQLEGSAAELYQRYLVPLITSKWAEDLIRRAQLREGEDVLDVACGTGVVARLAARKVAPGCVMGLDLNAGMLAVARSLLSEGAPVSWIEGTALNLPFPSARFDVVLCQLGLQFFPDQPRALRELWRVSAAVLQSAFTARSSERQALTHSYARSIRCWGPTLRGSSEANIPSRTRRNSKHYCANPASMPFTYRRLSK
jgi:ubiquinone/menaquinone biosynthesis C-methylase UbiE